MDRIRRALGDAPLPRTIVLRGPEPGELGWIVSRHGAQSAAQEADVARVVADFASRADPDDNGWTRSW